MKIESVKLLYNMAAHLAAVDKYPEGLMDELLDSVGGGKCSNYSFAVAVNYTLYSHS